MGRASQGRYCFRTVAFYCLVKQKRDLQTETWKRLNCSRLHPRTSPGNLHGHFYSQTGDTLLRHSAHRRRSEPRLPRPSTETEEDAFGDLHLQRHRSEFATEKKGHLSSVLFGRQTAAEFPATADQGGRFARRPRHFGFECVDDGVFAAAAAAATAAVTSTAPSPSGGEMRAERRAGRSDAGK